MARPGDTTKHLGRRRLLGLGAALTVGAAGALLPAADRYAGTMVAAVTGSEAAERTRSAVADYLAGAQTLVLDDQTWTVARQPLGLSVALEPAATMSGFLPLGRPTVALVATINEAALVRALDAIPELTRTPVDARLTLRGVEASIEPDQAGRQVDWAALQAVLLEQAQRLDDTPVALPMIAVPAATTSDDLRATAAWLDRILAQPFTLAHEPAPTSIPPADVAMTLRVEPAGTVLPDRAAWERLLAPLAHGLAVVPVEPALRLSNGRADITPPRPGRTLDIAATTDAIWAALRGDQHTTAPVFQPAPARATVADLTPMASAASRMLARPPVLAAGQVTHALTSADIERLVRGDLSLDGEAASALWQHLGDRVDIAPQPPFFRWRDEQAIAEGAGQPGRRLDRAAALLTLSAGLRAGLARIDLPIVATAPPAPPATLSFPDVLAEGRTYFGDSVRERYTNVALGLERINGALVSPGGRFSFNQASGPVTYATGFQRGYGIAISNGKVTTLPSVGGGICQVATTVFHAVFRAGLPVVERSWHLYWMPRYGRAPSGLVGLDATVDDQVGLDFQFVNATGNWLLVEAASEGGEAVVRLRGVAPGWRVSIDGPVISNVVRASQAMTERKDPSLRRGTRVWVEHAEDGKTVTITRSVRDERGTLLEQRAFVSQYAPAANVTLVGTG